MIDHVTTFLVAEFLGDMSAYTTMRLIDKKTYRVIKSYIGKDLMKVISQFVYNQSSGKIGYKTQKISNAICKMLARCNQFADHVNKLLDEDKFIISRVDKITINTFIRCRQGELIPTVDLMSEVYTLYKNYEKGVMAPSGYVNWDIKMFVAMVVLTGSIETSRKILNNTFTQLHATINNVYSLEKFMVIKYLITEVHLINLIQVYEMNGISLELLHYICDPKNGIYIEIDSRSFDVVIGNKAHEYGIDEYIWERLGRKIDVSSQCNQLLPKYERYQKYGGVRLDKDMIIEHFDDLTYTEIMSRTHPEFLVWMIDYLIDASSCREN